MIVRPLKTNIFSYNVFRNSISTIKDMSTNESISRDTILNAIGEQSYEKPRNYK